jgi:hypothetical protein
LNKKWLKRYFTKPDIVLIGIVIVATLASGAIVISDKPNDSIYANCEIDGKVAKRIELNRSQRIDLGNGMKLETMPGKIRVLQSDCPNQICVNHGWLENSYDVIVCVPNRTIIYLEGQEHKDSIDFITR